jgi:thiol-disulfide isomerase/thioredoxin
MLKKQLAFFLAIVLLGSIFSGVSVVAPFSAREAVAASKKMPVIELFTAEWCPPCATANKVFDEVYDELGSDAFIMIKQHTSGNGGMANRYSQSRANKFNVTGIPTAILDGRQKIGATDKSGLRSSMMVQSKGTSSTDVSFNGEVKDGIIKGKFTYAGAPAGSSLHVIICEKYFFFHGRNGEKIHQMISREGTIFNIGEKGTQEVEFQMPSSMASEMLRIVAFIENDQGISQGSYWNPFGKEPRPNDTILSTFPNQLDLQNQQEGFSSAFDLTISNFGKNNAPVSIKAKDRYVSVQEDLSLSSATQTKSRISIQGGNLKAGQYTTHVEVSSGTYSKTIPISFTVVERPELKVSIQEIDFGEVKKGTRPRIELTVENQKTGKIKGTINSRSRWLDFSPGSFDAQKQTIVVTANTRDLEAGIHEAEIQISTDGGQQKIIASVHVLASLLQSSEAALDFGEIPEEKIENASKTFRLSNTGSMPAEITLTLPAFVFTNEKSYKLDPEENVSIEVTLIPDKLKINELNEADIEITYTDGKMTIPVKVLAREMSPILQVSSDFLNEEEEVHLEAKAGENSSFELVLENIGKGRLEGKVVVSSRQSWMSSSHQQFALLHRQRRTITITIDTSSLKAGNHEDKVIIQTNGGEREIKVKLIVGKEPVVIVLQIGSKQASISGKTVTVDPAPYIRSGSTLVPLRFISEAFGAEIEWLPAVGRGTIVIKLNEHRIQVEIGNNTAQVNGKNMTLQVAPEIVSGRTFVPLRFISEAFGAQVEWIAATQTIRIIYEG